KISDRFSLGTGVALPGHFFPLPGGERRLDSVRVPSFSTNDHRHVGVGVLRSLGLPCRVRFAAAHAVIELALHVSVKY
ncbi:hypothetical protein CSUI_003429, partial [Cystoisospora suis]